MRPSALHRLYGGAAVALEWLAALILLAALLDMLLQVGARTFMAGGAPAGTEEGVRIALVWITFIGASAATLRGYHLVVDLFQTLSPAIRKAWDIGIALLIGSLSLALLYGGAILTQVAWPNVTPGLGWSGAIYYVPLLIFAGVCLLHSLGTALEAGIALARGTENKAPRSPTEIQPHQ